MREEPVFSKLLTSSRLMYITRLRNTRNFPQQRLDQQRGVGLLPYQYAVIEQTATAHESAFVAPQIRSREILEIEALCNMGFMQGHIISATIIWDLDWTAVEKRSG